MGISNWMICEDDFDHLLARRHRFCWNARFVFRMLKQSQAVEANCAELNYQRMNILNA